MPACDLLFWWFGRGLDLDRSDWRRLDSRLPRLVAIMSDRQSVSFRRGINGRRFIRFASSRGQVECNLSGAGRSQRECSAQAQEAERKADGFQHLRCPQRDLTRRQGPFWREKGGQERFLAPGGIPLLSIHEDHQHSPALGALHVCGLKDVESRAWPTRYRDAVIIHASQRPDDISADEFERRLGMCLPPNLSLGGVVGVTEIVDCVRDYPSGTRKAITFSCLRTPGRYQSPIRL